MLTLEEHRRWYAQHLHGQGVEIGALNFPLKLPEGVRARYVDYLSTDELRSFYPSLTDIVPVDIVLKAKDLSELADESLDFIVACHVIEHLPNPLRAIEIWASKLAAFGTLFIAFPVRERCPDAPRPINSIEHLVDDYNRNTAVCCDEDLLAFAWAWNPKQFPDPDAIGRVLRQLWSRGQQMLDDGLWGEVGEKNRPAIERLLANRGQEIHHHVFSCDVLMAAIEWVSSNTTQRLTLVDVARYKGLLSEDILIVRKYPAAFLESEAGIAVAKGQSRRVQTAMLVENWTVDFYRAPAMRLARLIVRLPGALRRRGERIANKALRRQK